MKWYKNSLVAILILLSVIRICDAQPADSAMENLQHLPIKYLTKLDSKIERYNQRISSRTEKALQKLSRWENKIQKLLQKVNPAAAEQLFGHDQTTFTTLLHKLKEGKTLAENYQASFDAYRDKLANSFAYLQQQKAALRQQLVKPLQTTAQKMDQLETAIENNETLEQFIKERKKQLIDQSLQYIGKSKYLQKIDKESYYYIETIKNYKALFSDPAKAEEIALKILNKIPAFQQFLQNNSQLSGLFRMPGSTADAQNLTGLQTQAGITALLQQRIASGGPNAQQEISERIQAAKQQVQQWQDQLLKSGQTSTTDELPNFKPNGQKTKTFQQRIEWGSNVQFHKDNHYFPTTADIGLSVGYKLNDKSVIGIGASYRLGVGSIERIHFSHEGVGLRTYMDWKLASFFKAVGGGFYLSGGYEMNHQAAFKNFSQLSNASEWQQSGLVGISKKIQGKTRWYKGTKLQLLYDMLHRKHVPVSQPVVFRMGYEFKKNE